MPHRDMQMTPCGKPFSSLISLTSTWCSDSSELCRAMLLLGPRSCPTPCNSMDCSPPGFSVRGDSPGKFTGVGCHVLLQEIFPTQGLNPLQEDSLPAELPGKPLSCSMFHHFTFCSRPDVFFPLSLMNLDWLLC